VGDRRSFERLENWPVLEKDELRAEARSFVADDVDVRRMFREQTSGTTGKPLQIWRSRRTVAALYALVRARTETWHDIPRGVRWGRLGGQLVIPVKQRRPPFWVWNAAMKQLYMSTYHLAPDLIPHYLDALRDYRISYLAGYTSSLVALAHEAVRLGRADIRMFAAFTNAEPLHEDQRRLIAQAFRCPVIETYGMTETVAHASRCPHGTLHMWPEVGFAEVLDENGAVAPGEAGELVCTGLLNTDMPLIRYRVGDRGRLAPPGAACACGRTLPQLVAVEGRSTDSLLTRDGRQVFWINPVFYGLPVRQSQVVQESVDALTVRVAGAVGYSHDTARIIVERLRSRMGDIDIQLHTVPEVPRGANGKLQAVVSRLTPDERAMVLARVRNLEGTS
jgi:phenylacetate-CoA ligase